jgi:hypothetical protein
MYDSVRFFFFLADMNRLIFFSTVLCGVLSLWGQASEDSYAQELQKSRTPDRPHLSGTANQVQEEIIILHSDSRSLLFEYRPRYLPQRTIQNGTERFTQIPFRGAVPLHQVNKPGYPDLHYRPVTIALPSHEGTSVRVLESDFQTIRDIQCPPVPQLQIQDGMAKSARYEKDRQAYSTAGSLPSNGAEFEFTGRARSIPLGLIKIFPVRYDLRSRSARKSTRMVIEVTFGPKMTARIEPGDVALFKRSLLNADVALRWSGPAGTRKAAQVVPSVLGAGEWHRLTVNEEGIYRLDAQWLSAAGISLGGVDPRTIKIYGNGGTELPENVTLGRPNDLEEVAVHVEGESDGSLDQGDFVLFYGRSPRGLRYDSQARTLRHYINHYTEENYYWLTFGGAQGKRMTDRPSVAAGPGVIANTFRDALAIEEEKINILGSGKDWLGQSIAGPSGSFTHVTSLPGLVPNEQIVYRYRLVAHSGQRSTFTVRESGTVIGTHSLPGIFGFLEGTANTFQVTGSSSLGASTSQLSFAYSSPDLGSQGWIDWVEIHYPRMLWGEGNYLRFRSPDTSSVVEYRLQQFSAMPWVFDVTEHDSVQRIVGVGGSYSFRSAETAGRVAEYCAAGPAAWKLPLAVQRIANQNLRGYAEGADFIILTSPEYSAAADRLKSHRERPENGNLKTLIVDVNQIYNEFGGGLPDITAVRDFLRYAYDHWTPRPAFALFLGGGSYDYKGILGFRSSFVPTWQSLESLDDVDSYATDDFFVKFGVSNAVSLVVGRISARNGQEADAVIQKVIRYDERSVQDSWKMRLLFIGADAFTPEGGEVGDRTIHSQDSEILSSTLYTPDEFEKRKIYIAEYTTENSAQGRRKPGAYRDIISQLNQGVLILNYAGHGNPNVWAHERIFEVGTSIPQLVNTDRLTVFFLATCNFSQFDNPKSYTGSEILMNRQEGGAVGVVSATRKVYAGANAALNQGTYRNMFGRDTFGRVFVERPATALFLYKTASGNFQNDQKFFYMGDPTMHLQYPRRYASIDAINGEPVDSVNGAPRQSLIQLKSLSRVNVSVTVRDENNRLDESYNGTLSLIVNDATRIQTIVNFYPGRNWDYLATGGTIYRGANSVTGGKFDASFIVPKDISYADSTSNARMVAYFSDAVFDGAGYTGKVYVGGTDTTAGIDREGPEITISLESRGFRPGDLVTENPLLFIDFTDSSGINTSGSGIGHSIEAWLNSSTQSVDLTEHYTSMLDDYTQGTVQYQLEGLPQGRNTVLVRAWDSYNNSSVAETFFEVASSNQLAVADVFNYPNPFSSETRFTFRHNQTAPIDVTVKVYTVAGRMIQTLDATSVGEAYVQIPWDGRDRDGDLLANGVYLYKVIVKTADGSLGTEVLGKMSIIR